MPSNPPSRPNILLMISHDLGRHLHCYGVTTVNSPNIDRLASQGVRFANAFCTAPSCSPSRASLFTGRYPHCNGVMGLCHGPFAWDLHADERHLAGLLHEAGYFTATWGHPHETRRPEDMGFDVLGRNGHCHVLADSVIDILQQRRGQAQPFYFQVNFTEPHRAMYGFDAEADASAGVTIPPHLVQEQSAREEFAYYQGSIRKVDAAVGRILESLDQCGLRDNTLVIYTTDHGIPFPRAKCSVYDLGLQIAQIMRYPKGGWEAGRVVPEMLSNIDVLPTLLELLGLPVPAKVQGRSFLPLLAGRSYEPRREIFGEMTYHDFYDPQRCIRTARHHLSVYFTAARGYMDPSQTVRPRTVTKVPADVMRSYHDIVELYDLETDPLETTNLASSLAHAQVRGELLNRLRQWMSDTADPLLERVPLSPMHVAALSALRDGQVPAQMPNLG